MRVSETLDRWVMRRMDAVACVSEAQAVKVRRAGVSAERSPVIRNAIRAEGFGPGDRACREELQRLFAERRDCIIAAAGRLSPEKGFDQLIEAAALVVARHPGTGFVLFGDGPLRENLTKQIAERGLQGGFVLAGFRSDLARVLPACDLAVSSSHTEGLPVVVLEEMAAGLPVVATAVGGTPEVVEDGVTGWLVPPGDAAALARRITDLLASPESARAMGLAGRRRVATHFTFAAMAEGYLGLFRAPPLRRAGGVNPLIPHPIGDCGKNQGAYAPARRHRRLRESPTMTPVEICFWIAAVFVVYPYAALSHAGVGIGAAARPAYPRREAGAALRFRRRGGLQRRRKHRRRLDEMTALLVAAELNAEVILVTDGATDATAAAARTHPSSMVRVIELQERVGKAAALSEGCAAAVHEILVFADVRQNWAVDSLPRMLSNFMDPAVGAVSGDLIVQRCAGVLGGVSLYWRFEKWLRRQESWFWSGVGATGAVSAVRRELFRPIPRGMILDDVYWPLQVAFQGYRVVHDDKAHAFDCLPERTRDEFRRKVRTLSGCFQLAARLPAVLSPRRNPIWLQFISHKLLRLSAPWGLLALFVTSLLATGPFYRTVFVCQAVCYTAALLGLWTPAGRWRPFAAAASFLVLNARRGSPSGSGRRAAPKALGSRRYTRGQGSGAGVGNDTSRPQATPASALLTPGP